MLSNEFDQYLLHKTSDLMTIGCSQNWIQCNISSSSKYTKQGNNEKRDWEKLMTTSSIEMISLKNEKT